MIPIFDSLTHPTLSGSWLGSKHDSSFKLLNEELTANGFIGASAVGIHNIEKYDHEYFMSECKKYNNLFPVAGFDLKVTNIDEEMSKIRDLGFGAVKLHPRFNSFNIEDIDRLIKIFKNAHKHDMIIFYCSYAHSSIGTYPSIDPFYQLVSVIKQVPNIKLIILHGGDVNILKYAELVRFNENILLDLSMTLFKYKGSSIDNDIKFLFKKFDRRICIGSDHPEHSHRKLRLYFDELCEDIDSTKSENIGFKNIVNFLKL